MDVNVNFTLTSHSHPPTVDLHHPALAGPPRKPQRATQPRSSLASGSVPPILTSAIYYSTKSRSSRISAYRSSRYPSTARPTSALTKVCPDTKLARRNASGRVAMERDFTGSSSIAHAARLRGKPDLEFLRTVGMCVHIRGAMFVVQYWK
jgi:hypothetical protein